MRDADTSVPVVPVQTSVLDRLGEVFRGHGIRLIEIGHGSRDLQYLYIQILTFSRRKTKSLSEAEGELGNDHKLPEFESGGDNLLTECSHVVLVRVTDFFDESVRAESFEQA